MISEAHTIDGVPLLNGVQRPKGLPNAAQEGVDGGECIVDEDI